MTLTFTLLALGILTMAALLARDSVSHYPSNEENLEFKKKEKTK